MRARITIYTSASAFGLDISRDHNALNYIVIRARMSDLLWCCPTTPPPRDIRGNLTIQVWVMTSTFDTLSILGTRCTYLQLDANNFSPPKKATSGRGLKSVTLIKLRSYGNCI